MDKVSIPQPIKIDRDTWLEPVFNRRDRRQIEGQLRAKPDLHKRRRCAGPSKPVTENNGYAALERQRREARKAARAAAAKRDAARNRRWANAA